MNAWLQRTLRFLHSEDGAAATEYAVLFALILIGVIATMAVFGERVDALYVIIAAATGEA